MALALLLAILAFIPARRLAVRGASGVTVAGYFLALWLLSLAIVALPGRSRLLVPVVVILAIVPFVTLRAGLDRLLGRPVREVRPPPRNVTPTDPPAAEAGRR
jgi:hypothetical protein